MKRIILLTLALCLLCASALAETCYTVLPAEIDEAPLLQATFGDRANDAQKENRDDGPVIFDLPSTEGPPWCDHSASSVQSCFGIYGEALPKGADTSDGSENVWLSGVAECALSREDALSQAEALLNALVLGEITLQSITAYGRIPGWRDCYQVAFLQRLNGRAVYWSSSVQPADYDEMTGDAAHDWKVWPETNRVELLLDDIGLIRMVGAWCRYEPVGEEITLMDEQQAVATFAALGMPTNAPELCYYLQYDGENATAIPAWRYLNRFLRADTGERLQ